QHGHDLGFAKSALLHLNLLEHLAEKILLLKPLIHGEDYPQTRSVSWRGKRKTGWAALRGIYFFNSSVRAKSTGARFGRRRGLQGIAASGESKNRLLSQSRRFRVGR
ncbi:hypothetical protein V6765_21075, partial [Martelella sp. FOR1707]